MASRSNRLNIVTDLESILQGCLLGDGNFQRQAISPRFRVKSNSFKRFMESIGSPIPGYEYKSRLRKEGAGVNMQGPKQSDKYNYNNISAVKRALKNYFKLESKADSGNFDALATLMDLRASMGFEPGSAQILTPRQKECISLCLVEDKTEVQAAKELGISQQAVFYNIRAGLRRIQKYLVTGQTALKVFSDEETDQLIALYKKGIKPKAIASMMKGKAPRTIQNKLKYLKKKGKLDLGK